MPHQNLCFNRLSLQSLILYWWIYYYFPEASFFQAYDNLFLEIPKQGELNSHQYLTNRSGEYAGGEDINAEIEALTAEVTQLREENVALQQQLLELANSIAASTNLEE